MGDKEDWKAAKKMEQECIGYGITPLTIIER